MFMLNWHVLAADETTVSISAYRTAHRAHETGRKEATSATIANIYT